MVIWTAGKNDAYDNIFMIYLILDMNHPKKWLDLSLDIVYSINVIGT